MTNDRGPKDEGGMGMTRTKEQTNEGRLTNDEEWMAGESERWARGSAWRVEDRWVVEVVVVDCEKRHPKLETGNQVGKANYYSTDANS
jgi:hypothetical protein